MKKLLFAAVTLDLGGIETALVTLLNELAKNNNYDITLVLEKKQGLFLNDLDKKIKIIEYTPNNNRIIVLRKLINLTKQFVFKFKYKNKFDFSCCYATYSNPDAFVARVASKNSVLWCHCDYLSYFYGDVSKTKEFFEEKKYSEFKKIVFVSKKSKDSFLKLYPECEEKAICINNLIDYKKILKNAEEIIEEKELFKDKNITTFINIGRHEERQKRLSRIIEAARLLKKDDETKNKFRIIFVGDGADTKYYKELIEKYQLDNEIILIGRKKNPYPYLKKSDCVILTSDYEGFPVVYVESMILNKPIITTEVSGTDEIKEKGFAIIIPKDTSKIYETMKKIIQKGFNIKHEFNVEKYNNEILEKIKNLF